MNLTFLFENRVKAIFIQYGWQKVPSLFNCQLVEPDQMLFSMIS